MKARVSWLEQAAFVAESGSGHALVLDGAPEHGGRNIGVRPMEMILMGLGGCTAFDIVTILHKARQGISDCRVELEAERAAAPPKVFTRIHLKFTVIGTGLRESSVRRAIELSTQKYCSATAMLRDTVDITHEFEIKSEL